MRVSIHPTRLNRIISKHMRNPPSAQQLWPEDVDLPLKKPGGQPKQPNEVEALVYDTALYFIKYCIPLTKCDMLELVMHVIGKLVNHIRVKARFPDGAPSRQWLQGFLKRHPTLEIKSTKEVKNERVEATVPVRIRKHLSRLAWAMDRYNIKSVWTVWRSNF